MRQITTDAISAFWFGRNFKRSNTQVVTTPHKAELFLHGHKIAVRTFNDGQLLVSNAGYFTNTTKERLNGLPMVGIHQRNWVWYLNGHPWNGEWANPYDHSTIIGGSDEYFT